ncbi:tRNA (guanine(26)-N(2))-dimethyltransferase [Nosema granulosis]|uniref:tRNA (guanine(26)-N(2))-dimethyltransferase n=1 Tax=Nosema granulosis TaxID=83296 RepID=A0A9P6H241_9MICR|nr:tRNA (guanine(26)-N(2))-dimethyltransferase [Nosema granulosis]
MNNEEIQKVSLNESIIEGRADINKYNTTFYNPAQKTNRDISVLVIREYFKDKECVKILDAMSATGLRGIRYLKEIQNSKVYFNDLNPKAIECIKENLIRNGLHENDIGMHKDNYEKIRDSKNQTNIIKSDCNLLMCSLTGFFDVIDIDPFGGCPLYIDNAFRAIKHNGLLCFTCTDKGVLCVNEEKCFVKYSTTILKGFSKHETPLRVVLSLISRQASKFDCSIEPLVSLSLDFYIRVFVRVKKNNPKSVITTNSLFMLCKCSNFYPVVSQKRKSKAKKINANENKQEHNEHENENNSLQILDLIKSKDSKNYDELLRVLENTHNVSFDVCKICQSKMKLCGPFWCDRIHNKEFVARLLLNEMDERAMVILKCVFHETDSPFYYEMTNLCSRTKLPCIKLKDVLYALQNLHFDSSLTHCEISGFKTNAPLEVIDLLVRIKNEDKDSELFLPNEEIDKKMDLSFKKGLLISHLGPLALPDEFQ